jgi:3-phosphoshikimate 1-carboxyvinyltransferase
MGARIRVENIREEEGEPLADLVAESSELTATEIGGALIPRVIDEIPALALAACFATGSTVIRDAGELRVKESDRIRATAEGLSAFGARVEETQDGMVIHGGRSLKGAECDSFGDHRIAMAMGVAGLLAQGETTVTGAEAADVSYPGFWDTLHRLAPAQDPR